VGKAFRKHGLLLGPFREPNCRARRGINLLMLRLLSDDRGASANTFPGRVWEAVDIHGVGGAFR
jgi:hypothetical protein